MFDKLIKRAEAVIEALPYLKKFYGKVIVIKYGGNAMVDKNLKSKVIEDLVLLKFVGMHPVLVHGGGPDITKEFKRKKIEVKFVEGLRVTDADAMEIVDKVLGRLNSSIVSLINKHGGVGRGISGRKGRLLKVKKHVLVRNKQKIDLGFVGEIKSVDAKFLQDVIKSGKIPVISSIGVDNKNNVYNVNADSAASAIAGALSASKLILLTNTRGVLDKKEKLISLINASKVRRLIRNGTISGGMIPKVRCGLSALKNDVEKVHIIDGRIPHAILLEVFTDVGIGTMVQR